MASSASTWSWSWSWSWNTTPDSSFRLSTFCNPSTSASTSSSSSCSSSSSSSSSFQRKSRRTHVTHFSLDSSPPASSSDRSRKITNNESIRNPTSDYSARNRSRKSSTQIGRLADGSFVLIESNEKEPNGFHPILRLRRLRRACLKLLFGKKPLWKDIFFASKKVRSIILLNVLTVIYASDIPVIKEVEEIMNPALFTFVRFAVFSIPFLPFILRARGDGQTRAAGIELGFWVSLGYLAQALGMLTSDAGRASFISAFMVVVVPLIDGMFGATVPAHTWFGALMSLMGVMMLESSGSPPSVGDILNILSAVFFGIHMLRTEHFSRIMKKENLLPLLGYEVSVIAIFSTIWYLFMGGFSDVHRLGSLSCQWALMWDWMASFPWVPAIYTGAFSTALCLWLEMGAMCDVSATETAIIYGLEPVWGAAFAWFLLGERWEAAGWVGAALVLGGSLTVQILGSIPEKPGIDEESSRLMQVSDKRDNLSVSTVVVRSRKDVTDLLKK